MAQQNINQGNPPIVWSTVDDAFQKINANFTELYLTIGGSGVDLTSIASSLIPDSNEARDLGSIDNRWRDLYLSSSSIYLGSALITADISGAVNLPAGSTVGGSLIKDPVESSFKIVRVSGQSDVVADDATDILNLVGSGIAITTNDLTDTVTFTNSGIVSAAAGTGISVAGTNPLIITNTGVRSISGTSGEIGVSSSTGAVTLTNLGVTRLSTDPGSGITLSGNTGNIQITNAAPNVVQDVFKNIAVLGQSTITATGPNSTLTVAAGNGISLTTVATFGLETLSIVNSGIISISVDSSLTYSVVSGAANLSLASTISRNLIGNVTGILTGSVVGNVDGDVNGSVFADDSTLLVDGTGGKIVGDIETSRLRTSELSVYLGREAGEVSGSNYTVGIGFQAQKTNPDGYTVGIGSYAGKTSQAQAAVAVGSNAGETSQGNSAVALGVYAGQTNQGNNAIAIGNQAGKNNQPAGSIVINSSGSVLNGGAAGFYVDPIREVTGPQVLYYDPTGTKEITWGPVPAGGGGGGGGDFELVVAADDSTLRIITSGETLQFEGANGLATTSDGEGKITIGFDPSGNISMGTTGTIEIFGVATSEVYIGGGTGGTTSGDVNLGNGTNTIVFNSATSGISYNDLDDLPGGSGLASRSTAAGSTGNIANTATANVTVTGFKGYLLYKIQTSAAAWVRVYTSVAARTADSGRLEGVDPSPGAGVITEVITTGAETILITPGTVGFNDESPVDTNIQLAVTNKSGGSANITVTLTIVKVED